MGITKAKGHKFDDPYKSAEEYIDKLFQSYPYPAPFNIYDVIRKSQLTSEEKEEAGQLYYEIRELLTDRFRYTTDHPQFQNVICLTEKGKVAKKMGGHFAYENHTSEQKENSHSVIIMGDQYYVKQAGAVGSCATANNNTLNFSESQSSQFDFEKLSNELKELKQVLIANATLPENYVSISKVAEAEIAAKEKDGNKVIEHLKSAGTWAFESAAKVGFSSLITEIIKEFIKH